MAELDIVCGLVCWCLKAVFTDEFYIQQPDSASEIAVRGVEAPTEGSTVRVTGHYGHAPIRRQSD